MLWRRMWVFIELDCVKRWLHTQQTKGRSPVWVRMCVRRFPISANALSHTEHTNGFSPRCIARSCRRRPQLNLNLTGHLEQANGCSELCTRWCRRRCVNMRNEAPHSSQRNRRIPAWTSRCAESRPGWRNCRPQSEQMYGVASEWVRVWYCSPLAWAKRLSHPGTSQTYGRSPVCMRMCTTSMAEVRNWRPHTLHMCLRSACVVADNWLSNLVSAEASVSVFTFGLVRGHLCTARLR